MSTQIVPFEQAPVPAWIGEVKGSASAIPNKVGVNQLTFRGKVWRTVVEGVETPLLNAEGDPVNTVHVVVLSHNKARSRAFYPGAYVEGANTAPACSSSDGIAPDADVASPQATTCAACPNAVKGSKMTPAGKPTTACASFKKLVVVPLADMNAPPMLLRLAQTSMWDANGQANASKGYYAWDQFLDFLRGRGAKHTIDIATKLRFDPAVAYPKLLFGASRWLSQEEGKLALELSESAEVEGLLNVDYGTTAERAAPQQAAKPVAGNVIDVEEVPPPPRPAAAPAVKATAPVAPALDDEEAPPPPAVKATAPAAQDLDDEEAPPPPPTLPAARRGRPPKAAAPAPAPAPAPAKPSSPPAANAGLAALIKEFDDE